MCIRLRDHSRQNGLFVYTCWLVVSLLFRGYVLSPESYAEAGDKGSDTHLVMLHRTSWSAEARGARGGGELREGSSGRIWILDFRLRGARTRILVARLRGCTRSLDFGGTRSGRVLILRSGLPTSTEISADVLSQRNLVGML
jgi:hypothetical protein